MRNLNFFSKYQWAIPYIFYCLQIEPTCILNSLCQCLQLIWRKFYCWCALRNQRHDSNTSMTTNDWAVYILWVQTLELRNEFVCSDDIQSSYSKDFGWVVSITYVINLNKGKFEIVIEIDSKQAKTYMYIPI